MGKKLSGTKGFVNSVIFSSVRRYMCIFSAHHGLETLLVLMLFVDKKVFFWAGLEERELSWLKTWQRKRLGNTVQIC